MKILQQMLQLMIQKIMNSVKAFLKNADRRKSRHKKKDEFSRRSFEFGENEDSNYGREAEEKNPSRRRRRLHVPNESFTIHKKN